MPRSWTPTPPAPDPFAGGDARMPLAIARELHERGVR